MGIYMNNIYYHKYLKYKNKYLELKNHLGGSHVNTEDTYEEVDIMIEPTDPKEPFRPAWVNRDALRAVRKGDYSYDDKFAFGMLSNAIESRLFPKDGKPKKLILRASYED